MNVVWGVLMLVIGLFMFLSAYKQSNNLVYRLMHARAKLLWKENAHIFLMISGLIISALSLLFFLGVWG
jgi:hypothetical protein